MHLAEFNFGTLAYPWGDPRIAGFENAVAQVNEIGSRSPGFVWRMPDEEMDAAQNDHQGALADRPNTGLYLVGLGRPCITLPLCDTHFAREDHERCAGLVRSGR